MAGGICLAISVLLAIFFIFIKEPPESTKKNPETDLRIVYAGMSLIGGVGMLAWGYIKSNRWTALSSRGQCVPIKSFKPTGLYKQGTGSVRIVYEVNGKDYTLARDIHKDAIREISDHLNDARVIYDPQNPQSAEVLTPGIARLPNE